MGRQKRAQSLLPSFVLVAGTAVFACEDGSKEWTRNPPPPMISNYGGYGNEGGSSAKPPMATPCPVPRPVAGSPCLSGLDCYYGTRDRCTSSRASCVGDVWTVSVGAPDCDVSPGVGGDSAGETPIAEGGAGGDSAGAGAGGVPIAEGGADSAGAGASGAPIAEGGAAGDGPDPEPVVYCPQTLPTLAASCSKPSSVTSFRCDYPLSCGTLEATCNGQWQLTFHDSATNSCLGGAPGN